MFDPPPCRAMYQYVAYVPASFFHRNVSTSLPGLVVSTNTQQLPLGPALCGQGALFSEVPFVGWCAQRTRWVHTHLWPRAWHHRPGVQASEAPHADAPWCHRLGHCWRTSEGSCCELRPRQCRSAGQGRAEQGGWTATPAGRGALFSLSMKNKTLHG